MEASIRRVGNSAGLILPAALLKSLGLVIGQVVEVEKVEGSILVTPKLRKSYVLDELLAQCVTDVPPPSESMSWGKIECAVKEGA